MARITWTYRLIFLLVLSVLVQIGLFVQMSILQSESETVFNKAVTAKEISEAINRLSNDLTHTSALLHGRQLDTSALADPEFSTSVEDAKTQLADLKKLTSDEPRSAEIIARSQAAFDGYLNAINEARSAGDQSATSSRHPMSTRVLSQLTKVVSDELVAVGKESSRFADESNGKQLEIRNTQKQLLRSGLAQSVLVTLVFAGMLITRLSRRISILNENVARLADGMPLQPVPGKGDEIADLSDAFSSMVEQLRAAELKEKAIVESARDLICSIDSKGNFVEVSRASQELLGFSPDEMRGMQLTDLLESRSLKHTLDELDKLKNGPTGTFETQLLSQRGRPVDTLWTAYWAEADDLTYCVVHDMSARKELDRIKQNIALMSTHDLRSPLTAIDNYFEMLQVGTLAELSADGKASLGKAMQGTHRMMSLIDDFLDLEKLDSGLMPLKMENFSVKKLLEFCREEIEDQCSEKGISLSVECKGDEKVYIDRGVVEKALVRILSFAVERALEDSSIAIEYSDCNVSITSNSDLTEDETQAVFERYKFSSGERGEQSLLGLYVCRTFIEANGGSVQANQDVDGRLVLSIGLRPGRQEK